MLWVVWLCARLFDLDISAYGILPRNILGLRGILFSPFIHDTRSIWHLISNTLPFMILFFVLINAYKQIAIVVLLSIHLLTGFLVWLLAPPYTSHIGISGIIYGIASFLVGSGLFRRDMTSLAIAMFIILLYGGMVEGFVPQPGISWQSHLFGALVGLWLSFILRHYNRQPLPEYPLELAEDERHFFEQYP